MKMLKKVHELIESLRKVEVIRKRNLGLSPDQSFLPRFIKRGYNQTETHKMMKKIVISELVRNGFKLENILVEKKPFKNYSFKPDVTLLKDGKYVFFECHYHDGWNTGSPSHIYKNIRKIKGLGRVIICRKIFTKRKNYHNYLKTHRVLSYADEVWFLNLEKATVERKFINN